MSPSATATIKRACLAVAVALALVLAAAVLWPQQAWAIEQTKATAKPNNADSSAVYAGEPTRVTWEGVVSSNEEVTELRINLPGGTVLSAEASAEATILNGTVRVRDNLTTTQLSEAAAIVEFEKPVEAGMRIRVEIYRVSLPTTSETYSISGTYINGLGESQDLPPTDPPIRVVGVSDTRNLSNWLAEQDWVKWWNSQTILKIFLNPVVIVEAVPNLFGGWLVSLGLVLLGFPLAIPIGLGISFLRMSRLGPLRFISSIYVNIIRGTPLFLQIYIAFLGLPMLGVRIPDFALGVLVLALNSSAYLAEIFRAGIQSIHKGQFEAANSLGMNAMQTMFSVIIPQTVRRVIPTATSEFILLFKDTSLLAAMGVMEQMLLARNMAANTGNLTPYVVAACFYLVVTLPLTRVIAIFEKKLADSDGRDAPPDEKPKKARRVGLFKTTAPLNATDSDPNIAISPEEHACE